MPTIKLYDAQSGFVFLKEIHAKREFETGLKAYHASLISDGSLSLFDSPFQIRIVD
jgi:hypothetical protein